MNSEMDISKNQWRSIGGIYYLLFKISVLIQVQANLPKTSPFSTCPNIFYEYFSKMFIVLGMYNFDSSALLRGRNKVNTKVGSK